MEDVVLFICKGDVQHLVRTATNVVNFSAICRSENQKFSKKMTGHRKRDRTNKKYYGNL